MITGHRWETDASERGERFSSCLNVADISRCVFDPNDAMVVSQPLPHVRLCAALDASCRDLGAHVGTRGVWGGSVRMMWRGDTTRFCCVSFYSLHVYRINKNTLARKSCN